MQESGLRVLDTVFALATAAPNLAGRREEEEVEYCYLLRTIAAIKNSCKVHAKNRATF